MITFIVFAENQHLTDTFFGLEAEVAELSPGKKGAAALNEGLQVSWGLFTREISCHFGGTGCSLVVRTELSCTSKISIYGSILVPALTGHHS